MNPLGVLPHPLLVVEAFVLGVIFGSFGNVLLHRLPKGKSIGGRSKCPGCKKVIAVIDLVPIISFCVLGAHCRHCKKAISWRYPLVETTSGLLFVLALFHTLTAPLAALPLALALWLLLLIAVTDAQTSSIPDALNIPFVACALLYAWMIGGVFALSGVLVAFGFFGLQWLLSHGRWIGSGDLILSVGIGALVGDALAAVLGILLAYVIGAVVVTALLVSRRKTLKDFVPFGPFLAAATLIVLLFGDSMLTMILGA